MNKTKKPFIVDRQISKMFKSTDKMFKYLRRYTLDAGTKTRRRVFIDNGAKVLFVAHMDTVCRPRFYGVRKNTGPDIVHASGLDDRLGVYVINKLVQECGLKADVLITDLEETGQTTANYHKAKDYNWIAEFDKAGSDVVTYGLACDDWNNALISRFGDIGIGSYTDICTLESTACAVNIGIGYERAHSKNSFFSISALEKQMEKFIAFYDDHCEKPYTRDKLPNYYGQQGFFYEGLCDWGYGYRNRVYDYDVNEGGYCEEDFYDTATVDAQGRPIGRCDFCNSTDNIECAHGINLCQDCFYYMIETSGIDQLSSSQWD
jgi:hypothetical protein